MSKNGAGMANRRARLPAATRCGLNSGSDMLQFVLKANFRIYIDFKTDSRENGGPEVTYGRIAKLRQKQKGGSMNFRRFLLLWRDQRGTAPIEYALIAVLVGTVIVHSISLLGTNASKVFTTIAKTI